MASYTTYLNVLPSDSADLSIAQADKLKYSNRIYLPARILAELSSRNFTHIEFKLTNRNNGQYVYAGVSEWIAPDNTCIVSEDMMVDLDAEFGSEIELTLTRLPIAKFVKIRPESYEFSSLPNPKATLEIGLRYNYITLTINQRIRVRHNTQDYYLIVEAIDPNDDGSASIADADEVNLDLVYVESPEEVEERLKREEEQKIKENEELLAETSKNIQNVETALQSGRMSGKYKDLLEQRLQSLKDNLREYSSKVPKTQISTSITSLGASSSAPNYDTPISEIQGGRRLGGGIGGIGVGVGVAAVSQRNSVLADRARAMASRTPLYATSTTSTSSQHRPLYSRTFDPLKSETSTTGAGLKSPPKHKLQSPKINRSPLRNIPQHPIISSNDDDQPSITSFGGMARRAGSPTKIIYDPNVSRKLEFDSIDKPTSASTTPRTITTSIPPKTTTTASLTTSKPMQSPPRASSRPVTSSSQTSTAPRLAKQNTKEEYYYY